MGDQPTREQWQKVTQAYLVAGIAELVCGVAALLWLDRLVADEELPTGLTAGKLTGAILLLHAAFCLVSWFWRRNVAAHRWGG